MDEGSTDSGQFSVIFGNTPKEVVRTNFPFWAFLHDTHRQINQDYFNQATTMNGSRNIQ